MKKLLLIICSLLLILILNSVAEAANNREKRIVDLLSKTEKVENLEDTVHCNKDFLEAVSLILQEAEKKKMGKEELMSYYLALLNKANWKKWIPYLRTTKVTYGIYLLSVASAAVTQPSSLYLFYDSSRLLIDRRDGGGVIDMLSYEHKGNRLKVVYRPEPGSTALLTGTAYLEKIDDKWKVIKVTVKSEHP
jgi:hypothetical protein